MLQPPDEAPVRETRGAGDAGVGVGAASPGGRPLDVDPAAGTHAAPERAARGPASRALTMMRSLWIIVRERFRD